MLRPGMYISDRYEIIERIGSGGMSDVYRALCHKLNRYVAVKVLKPEYSDDRNFVTKFRVEAQSVASLSHGNIVNIYDVGDDDGLYYIVMELVEGITLKEYIHKRGRLDIEDAVNIAIQVAMGIEAAHKNHIIHRDIKPQNIIINRDGIAKVMDFGIAKAATSNTVASNAMGSVHYISPEQARIGYSDEKSDIYSLGITIYEMVTGKVPFDGDNNISVAMLHIQGSITLPSDIRPDMPTSLESIILKCTQKKSERRYLVIGDLINDLKGVLANPHGNFVKVAPVLDDSPTIFMTNDEMEQINQGVSNSGMEEDDEYEYVIEYEEEDDDAEDHEVPVKPSMRDNSETKVEKLIFILGIAAGAILLIIVIFVAVKLWNGSSGKKENNTGTENTTGEDADSDNQADVEVISVKGMTLEEATSALERAGLVIGEVTYKTDEGVAAGRIISQSPGEGDTVASGSKINVVISRGEEGEAKEMINVIGMTQKAATSALQELGVEVIPQERYNDSVQAGKVYDQNPKEGEEYKAGDKVTIYISLGVETKEVRTPDLYNLTEAEARSALVDKNLKVGKITKEYHDSVVAGRVIRQSVDAGSMMPEGTVVDFTISLGKPQYSLTFTVDNPCTDEVPEGEIQVKVINLANGIVLKTFEDNIDQSTVLKPYEVSAEEKVTVQVKVYLNGVLISTENYTLQPV